jgi:hypothetical protein
MHAASRLARLAEIFAVPERDSTDRQPLPAPTDPPEPSDAPGVAPGPLPAPKCPRAVPDAVYSPAGRAATDPAPGLPISRRLTTTDV